MNGNIYKGSQYDYETVLKCTQYILERKGKKQKNPLIRGGGKGPATMDIFFLYLYILAQKLWRNFFLSNSVSGYFKTRKKNKKKFVWPLSRGEGGKGLSGRATKKRNFF